MDRRGKKKGNICAELMRFEHPSFQQQDNSLLTMLQLFHSGLNLNPSGITPNIELKQETIILSPPIIARITS